MTQSSRPTFGIGVDLFWHLLFFDMYFMSWRYGGVSVVSILLHGCFLIMAGGVLAASGRIHPLPRLFHLLLGGTVLLLLLQSLPLPDALFSTLAPIKHRLAESLTQLYPQIEWSSQAAMMPSHHSLRSFMLCLDLVMVALLFAAPAPNRRILPFWSGLTAMTVGLLAVAARTGAIGEHGILAPWANTIGGLINDNHFATLAVILILLNSAFFYLALRKKEWPAALFLWTACLIIFVGFAQAWSRSGLVNLAIGLVTTGGLLLLTQRRMPRLIPLFMGVGVVAVVFGVYFAFSQSAKKWRAEGIEFTDRIELNRNGLAYLAEGQLIGTGLGSVIALIEPVTDKEMHHTKRVHHLHNEYLQIALELGLPGVVLFGIFLFLALKPVAEGLLTPPRHQRTHERVLLCVAAGIVAVVGAHSLIDFPLRILSIRMLVLLSVFCAAASMHEELRRVRLRQWVGPAFLALASLVYFINYVGRIPEGIPNRGTEAWAQLYGRPFITTTGRTSKMLDRLIWQPVPFSEARQDLADVRTMLHGSFSEWPLNMRALNQLYMAELIEYEIDLRALNLLRAYWGLHDKVPANNFYSGAYDAMREKAETIRALGRDTGYISKFALHFLLELHQDQLNEEDRALWERWRKQSWARQQEGITPEHDSD